MLGCCDGGSGCGGVALTIAACGIPAFGSLTETKYRTITAIARYPDGSFWQEYGAHCEEFYDPDTGAGYTETAPTWQPNSEIRTANQTFTETVLNADIVQNNVGVIGTVQQTLSDPVPHTSASLWDRVFLDLAAAPPFAPPMTGIHHEARTMYPSGYVSKGTRAGGSPFTQPRSGGLGRLFGATFFGWTASKLRINPGGDFCVQTQWGALTNVSCLYDHSTAAVDVAPQKDIAGVSPGARTVLVALAGPRTPVVIGGRVFYYTFPKACGGTLPGPTLPGIDTANNFTCCQSLP